MCKVEISRLMIDIYANRLTLFMGKKGRYTDVYHLTF